MKQNFYIIFPLLLHFPLLLVAGVHWQRQEINHCGRVELPFAPRSFENKTLSALLFGSDKKRGFKSLWDVLYPWVC